VPGLNVPGSGRPSCRGTVGRSSGAEPGAEPAKKDVACRLHEPLAVHDTETLMRKTAFAARRLQDRSAGFLDLQKQRLLVVRGKQREIAARSDTAHTHHLIAVSWNR